LISGEPKNLARRERFIVPHQAQPPQRTGRNHRMLSINHERPFVMIAVSEKNDAHRETLGQRLLNDSAATQHLIVRMRREHEHAVAIRQSDLRRLRGRCHQQSAAAEQRTDP
jgi:hypothetical protein